MTCELNFRWTLMQSRGGRGCRGDSEEEEQEEEEEEEKEEKEEEEEEEDEEEALMRIRLNADRVLVLNDPPAMESRKISLESRNATQLAMRSRDRYDDTSTCRQGLTLVNISAQPEPFLTQQTP
jgi:hypothetical protein